MTDSASNSPVNTGLPWWLWVILIPVTIAVGIATVSSLMPEDPAALYTAGQGQLIEGNSEAFERTLQELKEFPEYAGHVAMLEGLQAGRNQRAGRALEFFLIAAENDELKSLALQRIGSSHAALGNFREAVDAFAESLKVDPNNTQTKITLASFHYAVGGLTHTIQVLDEVLATDDNRNAWQLRGQAHNDLGDFALGKSDFEQLLKTPGDRAAASPEVLSGYITAMLQVADIEELEEARHQFSPSLQDPSLNVRLAAACKDYEGAIKEVERATQGHTADFAEMSLLQAKIASSEKNYPEATSKIIDAAKSHPREIEVFTAAVAVFTASGDADRLAAAEENLNRLRDIEKNVRSAMREIGSDLDNAESRVNIAKLFMELRQVREAMKWSAMAKMIDPAAAAPTDDDIYAAILAQKPFVSLNPADTSAKPANATPSKGESDSTSTPSEDLPPGENSESPKPEPESKDEEPAPAATPAPEE